MYISLILLIIHYVRPGNHNHRIGDSFCDYTVPACVHSSTCATSLNRLNVLRYLETYLRFFGLYGWCRHVVSASWGKWHNCASNGFVIKAWLTRHHLKWLSLLLLLCDIYINLPGWDTPIEEEHCISSTAWHKRLDWLLLAPLIMVVESCNHHGWGIDLGLERLRQMNLGILPGVRHCCCRPSWSRWSNRCLLMFDIRLVDLNERLVKFRHRWVIVRCVYIFIIDGSWESLHRLISVHRWQGRLFYDDSMRCVHSTLVKEALALVFLQYHLSLHKIIFLLWILS